MDQENTHERLADRLADGVRSLSRQNFQVALSHAFGGDVHGYRQSLDRLREGLPPPADEARRLLTLARHVGLPQQADSRSLLRVLWLAAEGAGSQT